MNPIVQHIVAVAVMLAIAVPLGLLAPRLFAEEHPPQLGLGALHKVEIFNTDKCAAQIIAFTSGDKSIQVNIDVPRDGSCDRAVATELAAAATIELQNALTFCQPIADLPDDDPDRITDPRDTDPDAKSMYHDGFNLCSRPVIVEITWTGSEYTLAWKSANTGRK